MILVKESIPHFELRRTAAELLACAVCKVFPGVTLLGSTVSEFEFYYDFIAEQPINEYALPLIEECVRGLIKQDPEVRMLDMMRENAAALFEHMQQPFIAAAIRRCLDNIVSVVHLGEFYDFTSPLIVSQLDAIEAFKILSIESTHTYISEQGNTPVIRIHAAAFPDKFQLKKYIKSRKEAKKHDHRAIGLQLGLFEMQDKISEHSCVWLDKGTSYRDSFIQWWKNEHRSQHFELITEPLFIKNDANAGSSKDKAADPDSEYFTVPLEGINYSLPTSFSNTHAAIFASRKRCEADLPIRFAGLSHVIAPHNNGLWGLLSSQFPLADQAHIFCTPEQLQQELIYFLQFIDKVTNMFGFIARWQLLGRVRDLATACEARGISYEIVELLTPANVAIIQVIWKDSFEREWQGPQLKIILNCAKQFGLRYQGANGKLCEPVVIERSVLGSVERIIAILLEHTEGRAPITHRGELIRLEI